MNKKSAMVVLSLLHRTVYFLSMASRSSHTLVTLMSKGKRGKITLLRILMCIYSQNSIVERFLIGMRFS